MSCHRFRRRAIARLSREQGAALVEFALVLPILVVLLFGVLEFGMLFNYWIDETHLVNEGARWVVVNNNPGGSTPLQQYLRSQADTAALRTGGHVCVSYPAGTSNVGDPVRVDMSYDAGIPVLHGVMSRFPGFFGSALPTTIKVSGTSVMRLEAKPTNVTAGDGGTGAC
jgi:hypothetical protein